MLSAVKKAPGAPAKRPKALPRRRCGQEPAQDRSIITGCSAPGRGWILPDLSKIGTIPNNIIKVIL